MNDKRHLPTECLSCNRELYEPAAPEPSADSTEANALIRGMEAYRDAEAEIAQLRSEMAKAEARVKELEKENAELESSIHSMSGS